MSDADKGSGRTTMGTVFISYSHKDRTWLQKLQIHLKPFVRGEQLSIWDDTQLEAGDQWRKEIADSISAADVAVLLVSPDFLASDFIAEHELPPLLDAAKKRGITIIWLAVSESAYEQTEISDYQAANNPAKPLDSLDDAERNRVLVSLCRRIRGASVARRRANDRTTAPRVELDNLAADTAPFVGRKNELARLDKAWSDDSDRVLTVVAWGVDVGSEYYEQQYSKRHDSNGNRATESRLAGPVCGRCARSAETIQRMKRENEAQISRLTPDLRPTRLVRPAISVAATAPDSTSHLLQPPHRRVKIRIVCRF